MTYIVPISLILIYSITISSILKKRIEQAIPISVVVIAIIVYLFGMFDNLRLGVTATEIIAVMQVGVLLFHLCREKEINTIKEKIKNIITPGVVIYIILSIMFIVINKGRIFGDYDEFNHWARIIKNMFLYNTYGTNPESVVTFNEYPPFTAIFQFLFLAVKNIYSEDVIITAKCILYLSIIIPVTKNIKWDKSLKNAILIIPMILFVPMIFYKNFYLEILVDGTLGIMFGTCIFYAFQEEELNFKYINIFTMLTMMSLTKTSGIALAVLAMIIILLKIIIGKQKEDKKIGKELIALGIILVAVATLTGIWYIKVNGTVKRWNFNQYINESTTYEKSNDNHNNVAQSFVTAIFLNQSITDKNLTVFVTTLIIICTGFFVSKRLNENNKKGNFYLIAMIISIIIYMISMYFTYARLFEPLEADILSCFDRYSSTILLANVFFQLLILADLKEEVNIKKVIVVFTILICLMPQENIEKKYINRKNYLAVSNINRSVYTKIKRYSTKLNADDTILYIAGTNTDMEYLKALNAYELMPIKISQMISGVFSNIEQFENNVRKYDYVFIYRIKSEDCEVIKSDFMDGNVKNDTLYKVEENEGKIILKAE